jgi:hypothetical protein
MIRKANTGKTQKRVMQSTTLLGFRFLMVADQSPLPSWERVWERVKNWAILDLSTDPA